MLPLAAGAVPIRLRRIGPSWNVVLEVCVMPAKLSELELSDLDFTDTVVMRSVTGTVRRIIAEHRQLEKFHLG